MSQLVKLLRTAGRVSGRPTAGFGARGQESAHKRLLLVATIDKADAAAAKAAFEAGADLVEVAGSSAKLKDFVEAAGGPVGVAFSGKVESTYDFTGLEEAGVDYVKVEAGADVPATVFLLETAAVVLELKESFSDTMLKMLNFMPAKVVQVDSPANMAEFSVKQLMEKRVDRELISKPLLMKVGVSIKPDAAALLNLVSPNGLVVPAADVAAWKTALAELKEPSDSDDDSSSHISLRAPAA